MLLLPPVAMAREDAPLDAEEADDAPPVGFLCLSPGPPALGEVRPSDLPAVVALGETVILAFLLQHTNLNK